MIKRILSAINNLNDFSVLVIKIEIILSISYFIMAWIYQSTVNCTMSLVEVANNVNNFLTLGIINFLLAIIFGILFQIKTTKHGNNR